MREDAPAMWKRSELTVLKNIRFWRSHRLLTAISGVIDNGEPQSKNCQDLARGRSR